MLIVDSAGRLLYWSSPKTVDYLTQTAWVNNTVQRLDYPDTVQKRALYPDLQSLILYQLTALGDGSLSSISKLERVKMPSLKHIGKDVFSLDKSLSVVDASPVHVDERSFSGCEKLISVDFSQLTSQTLPKYALAGCKSLRELSGVYQLTAFGEGSLSGCAALKIDLGQFRQADTDVELEIGVRAWDGVQLAGPEVSVGEYPGSVGKLMINSLSDMLFAGQAEITRFCACDGGFASGSDTRFLLSGSSRLSSFDSGNLTSLSGGELVDCPSLRQISLPKIQKYSSTVAEHTRCPPFFRCKAIQDVDAPELTSCLYFDGSDLSSVNLPKIQKTQSLTAYDGAVLYGFAGTELKSVHPNVPDKGLDALTSIGDAAFASCGLLSIELGSSINSIAQSAFRGSIGSTISILTYEDGTAAKYATMLSAKSGEDMLCSYGANVIFDMNSGTLMYGCSASVLSARPGVKNHARVSSIGDWAFYGVDRFTYPVSAAAWALSNSVQSIGRYAFAGVKGLDLYKMLVDPAATAYSNGYQNLSTIHDFAFFRSTGVTGSYTMSKLNRVGNGAFMESNLVSGLTANSLVSVGVSAFAAMPKLVNVSLTSSMRLVGDYAFAGSGVNFAKLYMDDMLSDDLGHGAYAFVGCQNKIQLAFENNRYVNPTGAYAYAGSKLNSIQVYSDKYQRYPQEGMLSGCAQLANTTLYTNEKFRSIPDLMFADDEQLTYFAYSMPVQYWTQPTITRDTVEYVGSKAFQGCKRLSVIGFSAIQNKWQMEYDALKGSNALSVCFNKMSASELSSGYAPVADFTATTFDPAAVSYGVWYSDLAAVKKFCDDKKVPMLAVIDVKNHNRCSSFRHETLLNLDFQRFAQLNGGFPAVLCYVRLDKGKWTEEARDLISRCEHITYDPPGTKASAQHDFPYVVAWDNDKSVAKCLKNAYSLTWSQFKQYMEEVAFGGVPARSSAVASSQLAKVPETTMLFDGWGIGHDCMFGALTPQYRIAWFKYSASDMSLQFSSVS